MRPTGLYRFTSLARPVDPAYPTNKAILVVLPVAAIVAAVWAVFYGDTPPASTALSGALTAFGAWALTRELAPDDNFAAFLSMGFAFLAQLAFGPASVLPLFVAIFLVRIVNRTTGVPPRWLDSLLVTGFVIWASGQLQDPLLSLAAALAFYLDASLAKPARMQILFGTVCLIASMFFVLQDGVGMPAIAAVDGIGLWLYLGLLLAFAITMVSLSSLKSVGDIDEQPLNVPRVRAGMFLAGLLVAQAPAGESGVNGLLWASLGGVVAGRVIARFADT